MRNTAWLSLIVLAIGGLTGCGNASLHEMNSQPTSATQLATSSIVTRKSELGVTEEAVQAAYKKSQPESSAYQIGPRDVLNITVYKVPEFSKVVQVDDAGAITLPLIGPLPASGKSTYELKTELTSVLKAEFLVDPRVTIAVKEHHSQRVTIDGAFRKPGVYPLKGRQTLQQLIVTAGGLTEDAENTVLVFRNVNDKRQAARFDISLIRDGSAKDPELRAGDVIVANNSALMKGYRSLMKALPLIGLFALI